MAALVTSVAKKRGFLFRNKKYLFFSNLYTPYFFKVRSYFEYYSYIWEAVSPMTLHLVVEHSATFYPVTGIFIAFVRNFFCNSTSVSSQKTNKEFVLGVSRLSKQLPANL